MSIIKITSGKYRGQGIMSPDSKHTHPMGAREKLALFNMISEYLPGAVVLDAFAGSGALGIETISRGAESVTFVEKSSKACQTIRDNLTKIGISGEVIFGDVVGFTTDKQFDIILTDPPYDDFNIGDVQYLLKFLKDDGIFVLSHPDSAPNLPGLEVLKTRRYAAAHISVYAKR